MVDDAIVVVENVERHMEAGEAPKEAAISAMTEVKRSDHRHRLGPLRRCLCRWVSWAALTISSTKQFAITIATAVDHLRIRTP